ncbi:MAG: ABC transporter ATP-binding protein [Candidatus Daviesbacteria bacterium]|nr:ABC transporter ATP-binding protein [Candidatus Daviesbacteria bacterium]
MILKVSHVFKTYKMEGEEVHALNDVSLEIKKGEFVSITGPSGSGKSTLMHIIGLLDNPTSGEVILDGKNVASMSEKELAKLRNKYIGFVFQQYNLLPRTSSLENVEMPMIYGDIGFAERKRKATELLTLVGLQDKLLNNPNQLSGGQQQRVTIARALAMEPAIILADEPTGNLDSKTGAEIMKLFHDLNKEGHTIILVTHDSAVAVQAKRTIKIKDGKIV